MGLRVAELETLFTADITDTVKKSAKVDATMKALTRSDPVVKVGANVAPALAGIDRVQDSARKLTSADVVTRIDADITKAQTRTGRLKTQLEVLQSLPTDVTITADITRAQKALDTTQTRLKALQGARAEMVVVADTSKAEAAVGRAKREVDGATATFKVKADTSRARADIGGLGGEGSRAGEAAGEGLSAGIIGALATIPIAGAVVGIGAAIGKSLMDGLQVEVRSDRLMAQTGLDAKTVAPIARAAGEAYANNWGSSIAENMATAKTAIQGGLLNPKRVSEDSQAIIESLSGVADILGEEIPAVARATAQILKTGLAKDAQGAFDLLVKGAQAGVNKSEDLLDTFNEYSTQFRKLGLEGPQALGLMSQAIRAGARDSDIAADVFKEFSIRAVDGSKLTAESFKGIGLNAKTMSEDIAAGGPRAAAALDQTLDKLRGIEDPAKRAQLAVGLFGTQSEDMGDALFAMDLSTAVAQLGTVEGAAQSALDTLGTNAAGSIASAQRNIEVAADGIKGAMATAFAPQIEGFATFVTTNREAVMQFLLDMANGGLDAGRSFANAAASGVEGFGGMVSTVVPMILSITEAALKVGQAIAFAADPTGILGIRTAADQAMDSFREWKPTAEAGAAAIKTGSETAAQAIRDKLIRDGIDPAQARLNGVAIPLIAQAKMHDMSVKLAKEIDAIKQGKVPGVNANTAAGKKKIAALQAQIDALKDKKVTLTVYQQGAANKRAAIEAGKADGGPITGVGGPRQDNIPLWGSVGEFMVNAASYKKHGSLVRAINADRFADGGEVGAAQRLADGGFVAADFTDISGRLPTNITTRADVSAARLREARATRALHTAEKSLYGLRRTHGHTAKQVDAAEDKITKARRTLRSATASLSVTEKARAVTVTSLATKFHLAAGQSNAVSAAFLKNIDTLRGRGFTRLADQLVMQADDQAVALAAQAVKSNTVARTLTSDVKISSDLEAGLTARQDAITNRNAVVDAPPSVVATLPPAAITAKAEAAVATMPFAVTNKTEAVAISVADAIKNAIIKRGFIRQVSADAPSLVGVAIEGTMDMGGGLIGVMRGVVKAELDDRGAKVPYMGVS